MPVIHTHVSVSTTPGQREALKTAYGKAILYRPRQVLKAGWCAPLEDNMPIYFGGDDSKPAAYVEVNVFGRSVPGSAWEKLTEQIMAALGKELGIPADRTYIRYTATTDWGWNGGRLSNYFGFFNEVPPFLRRFAHIANLSPHLREARLGSSPDYGREIAISAPPTAHKSEKRAFSTGRERKGV